MSSVVSSVRTYAIVARRARVAAVFRRGPTKLVQMLRWDLSSDRFEPGQWLRGRVYERRCDLSPRGDLVIYFAAKNKGPIAAYTAISKPPYFTALALWPSLGTYGGGGLFVNDYHVELNHDPFHRELREGFSLRPRMQVSALGEDAGRGEDYPIEHLRMIRDGWRLVSEGHAKRQSMRARTWIVIDPPRVYAKPRPKTPQVELEQRLLGIHEKNGPWHVLDHALVDRKTGRETLLERCEWADWDHQGDLLFAREGRLWRARVARGALEEPRAVIDLRGAKFERVIPPPEARVW